MVSRRRFGDRGLLLCVGSVAAFACGGGGGDGAPVTATNLILFSIDTLRADRLGAYGYERPTSPTIDALAERGVRFETVIAETNWTLPSHVTLFTGLAPSVHGVKVPTRKLASHVVTLPEILRESGFRTIGVTGGGFVGRRYGFERGFEFFSDADHPFADALAIAAREIDRVAGEDRFFAFIHTFEVHCPYHPPESFASAFETQGPSSHVETRGRCGSPHFNEMALSESQVRFISDRYDAGIRYADHLLAGFIDWLDQRGRLDDTLLVLVSDHGEEFHEHGRIGHVQTVYLESLRIPWIMVGPGLDSIVIDRAVGLSDVLPTVLGLMGLAGVDRPAPLLPLLRAEPGPTEPRVRYSENDWDGRLRSVVIGDHHAIYRNKSREFLLFDWRADAREQTNLAGRDPALDRELQSLLYGQIANRAPAGLPNFEKLEPPDAAHIEQLRALGYVE